MVSPATQKDPATNDHVIPNPERHERVVKAMKNQAEHDAAISDHDKKAHAHHSFSEGVALSIVHAIVPQIMKEMVTEQNMVALTEVVTSQAANMARLAVSDVGRYGTRISAQEAFTGSYDAIERKWLENLKKPFVGVAVAAVIVYVGLLAVGLLFSVWRYAMLG